MSSFRLARALAACSLLAAARAVANVTQHWWTEAGLWVALAVLLAWWSHAAAEQARQEREIDRRIARGNRRLEMHLRGSNNVRVYEAPTVEELVEIWERGG